MKILLINYEYPPLGGGGGVASEKLAKGWAQLGHEVHVLTTKAPDLPPCEKRGGVNIYRVPVLSRKESSAASISSLITFPLTAIPKGISLCLKNKYDAVNTHFAVPTGPAGFVLSKLFKIPNVLSLHGADIYDPTRKYSPHQNKVLGSVVRFILNTADAVVAQSSNTKENAKKYFHPNKEITVIPLAFEKPSFRKISRLSLGLEEDGSYIISIGRLVKRKGFGYLVEALDKLNVAARSYRACERRHKMPQLQKAKAVIIGEGPEKSALQKQIKDLGLEDKVKLLGFVPEEKKFQYLACSDIYVLSSLHEGFGIVLQEAMEVGLPIVATNWGGQTDFLADGENALLVPPGDPEALVTAIKKLLDNQELMRKMRNNNKEKVKQFYIPNVAKQYLELFDKMIPSGRRL